MNGSIRLAIAASLLFAFPGLTACNGNEEGGGPGPGPVEESLLALPGIEVAPQVVRLKREAAAEDASPTTDPEDLSDFMALEEHLEAVLGPEAPQGTAKVSPKTVLANLDRELADPSIDADARNLLEQLRKRLEEAGDGKYGGVPHDASKRSESDKELQAFLALGAMAMVAINPALAPVAMILLTSFGGMTQEEARSHVSTGEQLHSDPSKLDKDDLGRLLDALPGNVDSKVDLDTTLSLWRVVNDLGTDKGPILEQLVKNGLDEYAKKVEGKPEIHALVLRVRDFLNVEPGKRTEELRKQLAAELAAKTRTEKQFKLVVGVLKKCSLTTVAQDYETAFQSK